MKCPLHLSLSLFVAFSFVQLAESAEPPKLSIVEPKAGQQITGTVKVRVAVEGTPAPKSIYVGLGKLNWREMDRDESTGEWVGTIDSTLVPNGQQVLRIITDNKKVGTARNAMVENPLKVFFADLHSHCGYSDGALIPAVANEYARDVAKLDVFCLTDHLEQIDDAEWIDTREVAWDANQDGRFVAFPGLEWTKKWGAYQHLRSKDTALAERSGQVLPGVCRRQDCGEVQPSRRWHQVAWRFGVFRDR